MKKMAVLLITILMMIVPAITGCLSSEESGDTVIITDMAGRSVEVPVEVNRIVGIEAGALRMIIYMDAFDMVVGVEDVDQVENPVRPYTIAYHEELNALPSIGPIHGGEPELIAAVQPDVIFWTYATAGDADDLQAQTGIPVVVLDYGDLDDKKEVFYSSLRLMGEILHKEERAEELISFFEGVISDLRGRTENITDPAEAYVGGIAMRGAHGICSTDGGYLPFLYTNVTNIATEHVGHDWAMVDPEALLEWDPPVIFVDECGLNLVIEDLTNTSKFGSLSVLQTGQIYCVMPYNWYTTNWGTVLCDAYYVGKTMYPERFADVDLREKCNEIYTFLVGEPVYDQMVEVWGGFYQLEL